MRDTIFAIKLIFAWLAICNIISHAAAAFLSPEKAKMVNKIMLGVDIIAVAVIAYYLYF